MKGLVRKVCVLASALMIGGTSTACGYNGNATMLGFRLMMIATTKGSWARYALETGAGVLGVNYLSKEIFGKTAFEYAIEGYGSLKNYYLGNDQQGEENNNNEQVVAP